MSQVWFPRAVRATETQWGAPASCRLLSPPKGLLACQILLTLSASGTPESLLGQDSYLCILPLAPKVGSGVTAGRTEGRVADGGPAGRVPESSRPLSNSAGPADPYGL